MLGPEATAMPLIDAIAAGVMLGATLGVVAVRAARARHVHRVTRLTADLLGEGVQMLEHDAAREPGASTEQSR